MKTTPIFLGAFLLFGISSQSAINGVKGTSISLATSEFPKSIPATYSALQAAAQTGGSFLFGTDGNIVIESPIVFTKDTVLDQNGYQVVISGGDRGLFKLSSGVNLKLHNLTLTGRQAGGNGPTPSAGSAIFNEGGDLIISHCHFDNHRTEGVRSTTTAAGNAEGAAICQIGGTLWVINSRFTRNMAIGEALSQAGGIGEAKGGAISLKNATATILGSTFESNGAAGGGTSFLMTAGPAGGGAIYIENSTVVLSGSFFIGNKVSGSSGLSNASGGSIWIKSGNVTVSECEFSGNTVSGGGSANGDVTAGAPAYGGAIMNEGELKVSASSFLSNVTFGGQGRFLPGGDSKGGAIYNQGALAVVNSTLAFNGSTSSSVLEFNTLTTLGVGGAIFSQTASGITNSAIVWNSDAENGIAADLPGMVVKNSLLAGTKSKNAGANIIDAGHNISSDETPLWTALSSRNNLNPRLGPLWTYGGSLRVFPLTPGSPAIDAGDDSVAPPIDQRRRSRPFGARSDIGPFESSPPYYFWGNIRGYRAPNTTFHFPGYYHSVFPDGSFMIGLFPAGPRTAILSGEEALFRPNPVQFTVLGDQELYGLTSYKIHSLVFDGTPAEPAFTLAGLEGERWRVESSRNLISWTNINTFTLDGTGLVTIPVGAGEQALFLRAIHLP